MVPLRQTTIQKELEYRRKKQWDVFSWSSTLLVAITGGVIALQTTGGSHHELQPTLKVVVSIAIATLLAYAVLWVTHNQNREQAIMDLLGKEVAVQLRGKPGPRFGYRGAIVLLALSALLATWLPL